MLTFLTRRTAVCGDGSECKAIAKQSSPMDINGGCKTRKTAKMMCFPPLRVRQCIILLECLLLDRRCLDAGSTAGHPGLGFTHDALEECEDATGLAGSTAGGVVAEGVEVDGSSSHG